MNILFIGIGVVGQRHIRNIKSNFKNIKFYNIHNDHSKQVYGVNKPLKGDVNSKYNLKTINFNDINKKIKIDAAFICLPNYLHSKFVYSTPMRSQKPWAVEPNRSVTGNSNSVD